MSSLSEFRKIVDNVSSEEELLAAQGLLRDIMHINDMKEKISELEESLSNDQRAMFYFFASQLDPDEVIFAAEKVSGKINRLRDKADKKVES